MSEQPKKIIIMKKIYKLIACVLLAASINCVYADSSNNNVETDASTKKETSVYPNPSSEYVNVVSESLITKIEVRNITGYVVFEKVVNDTNYFIDVTTWQRGKYIVTIFHEKDFEMRRVSVL